MSGLSNANFMSGLMQGYGFADRMATNSQARGLRDAQESRRKQEFEYNRGLKDAQEERASEIHAQRSKINDMNIYQAEHKQYVEKLKTRMKALKLQKKDPALALLEPEFKMLRMEALATPEGRSATIQDGKEVFNALKQKTITEGSLNAIDRHMRHRQNRLEQQDGMHRRLSAVHPTPNGLIALENTVTKKNGEIYQAPITQKGTADDSDVVKEFTQKDILSMGNTIMHKAEAAHILNLAGDAPDAQYEAILSLFEDKAKPKYTVKKGYGEKGGERLVRIGPDGKFAGYVGGEKAKTMSDADYKAKNVELKRLDDSIKIYNNRMAKIDEIVAKSRSGGAGVTGITAEEERKMKQSANSEFVDMFGFDPEKRYLFAREYKRMPHSIAELNAYTQGVSLKASNNDVNELVNTNKGGLFGSGESYQQVASAEEPAKPNGNRAQIAGNQVIDNSTVSENYHGMRTDFARQKREQYRKKQQDALILKFAIAKNPIQKIELIKRMSHTVNPRDEKGIEEYKALLKEELQATDNARVRDKILSELSKYGSSEDKMAAVFTN